MFSKNLKDKYDVIIIGDGIASKVFLFSLLERVSGMDILVIESPLYSSCSIKTTSHVAVAKAVDGSGPLGDLVVSSFFAFKKFFETNKPSGIELGHFFYEEFKNPQDHYFVTPSLLFQWFDNFHLKAKVDKLMAHVQSVHESNNEIRVKIHDIEFSANKVLMSPGPGFTDISINGVKKDFYRGFVRRPGSFWVANAGDYECSNSWVFSRGKANLIYRKSEQIFLLGGTTNLHDELGIDFKTLVNWHKDYFESLDFLTDFKQGSVDLGIRFRGPKRMPISGLIPGTQNVFALTGLHKNGFSYPFVLADKCLDEMFGG